MTDKATQRLTSEQLIDQLASNIKPVTPARLRTSATIMWNVSIVAMTGAMVAVTGHLRSDLFVAPIPGRIVIGFFGALVTTAAAGAGFVRLLVPGRRISGLTNFILAIGSLLMAWSVIAAGWGPDGWSISDMDGLDISGFRCTAVQSIYAAVLSLPLIFGAKRYAPTRLLPLGLLIGLMAVAAGFGGLLLHCPSDDIVHLAVYHLVPAIVLSVGACSIIAAALRW